MAVVDLHALEEAIGDAVPELRVAPLRELGQGFGSVAVETADRAIFRVARTERVARAHAREASLLIALAPHLPCAVPQPEWRIDPRAPALPFGAVGYRKLEGESLSPDRATGPGAARLASALSDFLVALHAFPLERARDLAVREADGDRAELEDLRDAVLPLLRDVLSRSEYEVVAAWSETLLVDEELLRFSPVLRHGDLWYGNVLIDPTTERISAVLDWDNAAIGDPAWDLARQLHLGEAFAAAVAGAYRSARRHRDPGRRHRIQRRWELLEFEGVRGALELGDAEELDETIAKLRAGPILRRSR